MEEPSDLPEDNDFEVDEPAVVVAPNPVMNGTAAHPPQQPNNMVNKVVTEKYTVSTPINNMMGGVNRRQPYSAPKQKELDDQDFLEKMNLKAEADDYQLQITRNLPSCNADGDQVPCGVNSKHLVPVMSYESLRQEITDAWGGGKYRVTFVDIGGRRVAEVDRCINIEIPTTQCPPKREKFEKIEPVRATAKIPTANDVLSDDERAREREYQERVKESRRKAALDAIESQEADRELKKLERQAREQQIREKILNPAGTSKAPELALLEKRLDEEKHAREEALRKSEKEREDRDRKYEDDRKERETRYERDREAAQRRADDDRKLFMDGLTKVTEKLTEVANRPPPVKEDSMKELFAVMAPIITAIVSRPTPVLPDNKELIVAMNESQNRSLQMLTTAMTKQPDNSNEKMFDAMVKLTTKDNSTRDSMIQGLMTALMSKDKGQVLTPEMIFSLQDKMEQRIERMMNLGQPNAAQGGEDGEGGYDPALGFLGNTGKALFGSLKALMDSAATNPALLDLVGKVIGSRNPTDQQLMQTAQYWDQNGIPPALMQQQQRPQLQYQPIPPAIPYNPQQPPQQAGQLGATGPGQARPMPPPIQPSATPAPAVNAQQQAVASELEGGATGIPTNGDPEQQRVLTPEEEAEENLRDAVTATVGIMIGEVTGKPQKRVWPEDATDHWNASFVQNIVAQFDGNARMQLIAAKCDPEKMQQLVALLRNDPYEQDVLWTELRRFVAMNTKQPVAVSPSPVQAAPAPVATPLTVSPVQG